MTDIQSMLVLNAILVWILQAVKSSKYLPWITAETQAINKLASALLAALASAGMVFSVVHTGSGGTGEITLHYAGVTTLSLANFLWHWVGNYAIQKGWFKLFTLPSAAKT